MKLAVRDLEARDSERIVDYFHGASEEFLRGMGVAPDRLPDRTDWISKIADETGKSPRSCTFFYLLWCIDDDPVGHSSLSNIEFGSRAKMHLHLWNRKHRKQGLGTDFLRLTIPLYFERFSLSELICEPYAHNPAPNRVLTKLGFTLTRRYVTEPGWINSTQDVNRYILTKESGSVDADVGSD